MGFFRAYKSVIYIIVFLVVSAAVMSSTSASTSTGAGDEQAQGKKNEKGNADNSEQLLSEIHSSIQRLKYINSSLYEKSIKTINKKIENVAHSGSFLSEATNRINNKTASLTYLTTVKNQLIINKIILEDLKIETANLIQPLENTINTIQLEINSYSDIEKQLPLLKSGKLIQIKLIQELSGEARKQTLIADNMIDKFDKLFNSITLLQSKNESDLSLINKHISSKDENLFKSTGSIFSYEKQPTKEPSPLATRLHDSHMMARNYLHIYKSTIALIISFGILISFLLYVKKDRTSGLMEEDTKPSYHLATSYPFSTAIGLTILASLFFLPLPPTSINLLIFIAATLPAIRFGIHRQQKGIYPYEMFIIGGFISLLFLTIFPLSLLTRLSLLIIDTIMAYSLFMLWNILKTPTNKKIINSFIELIFLSSFILIAISITLNIYGLSSLSLWLTNKTLFVSFFGFLIYALSQATGSIWSLICYSKNSANIKTINQHRKTIFNTGIGFIRIAAAAFWIFGILLYWGVDIQFSDYTRLLLNQNIPIGSLSFTPGHILLFVFLVWASFKVASASRIVFNEEIVPRSHMKKGIPLLIGTSLQASVLIFGFLFALASSGINLSNITLVISALGVGIGLGLQSVVLNFVSGVILMIERPIRIGDIVELSSESIVGEVLRIGLRTSTIKTFDGADVVVPNSKLTTEQIINWTLSSAQRRVVIDFGVAYGSDYQQVIDLILELLNKNDTLLTDPAPSVLFMGLGDSSLNFQARCWVPEYGLGLTTKSELIGEIYNTLNENNIEIPFPQQDIYIKNLEDLTKETTQEAHQMPPTEHTSKPFQEPADEPPGKPYQTPPNKPLAE